MADRIQIRRDTAVNWATVNPVLAQGELGVETNTNKFKVGDGATAWAGLAYLIDAGDYLSTAGAQTLTNKTIAFGSNTLTGVQAALVSGTSIKTINSGSLLGSGNIDVGDVTLTGSQVLTNKTIEAGVFTNGYTEEVATANTGTAYTIDLAGGSVQILTLTGNCTFTFPTATAGKGLTILLKQDATGSRTVTWPAAVKWPAGTAPTITATASKLDKYVFTADGTNWYGSNAGQNYTV